MTQHKSFFLLIFLISLGWTNALAQLPANTVGSMPRVAIAGDSWAQYMADDNSHSDQMSAYGQADKIVISKTFEIAILCSGTPGPTDYAVSGSEARQWANEVGYDYLQNLIDALNANPTVDLVILSIGGNDVLAGRSDGGWYKDMDLDVPGSEAALFNTIMTNTIYIMNQVWLRSRPNIKFVISSYDYPNFNVSSPWCGFYACDKREDLSRDTNGNGNIDAAELITDLQINALMLNVEVQRQVMADANPNIYYDNSMGLTHYYYGYNDGLYPAVLEGTTPYPQGVTPYALGGSVITPTDRDNFRLVGILCLPGLVSADPIHLDAGTYTYKVKNQMDNILFDLYRGQPNITFWSEDANDGYVDVIGSSVNASGIRVGDDGPFCCFGGADNDYRGILSFDTSSIPDNASITGASLYMMRSGVNDNPFDHLDRDPVLDIKSGFFGTSAMLETVDGTAAADASDIGYFYGSAPENKHAIRMDIDPAALIHVNKTGDTQFRFYFDFSDWSAEYINFYDGGGTAAFLPEDVSKDQEQKYFESRIVTKTIDADGMETIIAELNGDRMYPIEGYVLEEKLTELVQNSDQTITEYYQTILVLEHAGLSKYMTDNYGAPGNGLAPFLDVQYAIILPLNLLEFNAYKEDRIVHLEWKTSEEQDVNGFEIQHRSTVGTWKKIGMVHANLSNANEHDYHFVQENPETGFNYYRLKIINDDESFTFSSIQQVEFIPQTDWITVSPNPFSDQILIRTSSSTNGPVDVELYNTMGQLAYRDKVMLSNGSTLINLGHLPDGLYTIRVSNKHSVYTFQLLKSY